MNAPVGPNQHFSLRHPDQPNRPSLPPHIPPRAQRILADHQQPYDQIASRGPEHIRHGIGDERAKAQEVKS